MGGDDTTSGAATNGNSLSEAKEFDSLLGVPSLILNREQRSKLARAVNEEVGCSLFARLQQYYRKIAKGAS